MNLIIKYNIQAPQSQLYPPEYSQGSGAASPAPAAAAGQHQHSSVSPLIFLANSPAQPQPSPSPGLQPTHHYSPTQGHKIHKFVNLFNAPAGCSRGPGPELGPSRTIYSELIFLWNKFGEFPPFPYQNVCLVQLSIVLRGCLALAGWAAGRPDGRAGAGLLQPTITAIQLRRKYHNLGPAIHNPNHGDSKQK